MGRHDRAYGVWSSKTFRVHRKKAPQYTREHSRSLAAQHERVEDRAGRNFTDNVRAYLRARSMTPAEKLELNRQYGKVGMEMGRHDGNTRRKPTKPQQPKKPRN